MKENDNARPKRTKLHEAAENGNLSRVQSIIENLLSAELVNTDDFNPKDAEGQTPFHLAAKYGHLEICRLILANIVDKNPVNNDGETPSQLAACHGHLSVMELIKSELSTKVKNGLGSKSRSRSPRSRSRSQRRSKSRSRSPSPVPKVHFRSCSKGDTKDQKLIKSELSKIVKNGYSNDPNKHVVQNNHGGWTDFQNQINVWSAILKRKIGLERLKSYIWGETP